MAGQDEGKNHFSSPPSTHAFSALLFDMDGTLVDSTAAIVKHWHRIGQEIGVEGDEILKTSHGRRSIDVLASWAPDRATWDYVRDAEGAIPVRYGADAVEIPGARRLVGQLCGAGAPWAIVTSGTRALVTGWLDVMRLAHPTVLVTAEDVRKGKPDPEPYVAGAEKLGVRGGGSAVLVLEDAPSGVRAGKAAGFTVVALATTHDVGQLREAGADWIVRDLESVRMERFDGQSGVVVVELKNAWAA